MEDWLPELTHSARVAELSLVYELEETRQRLYEMAEEAQEAGDLTAELRIHQAIIKTIKLGSEFNDDISRDPIEKSSIEETMDDIMR